MVRGFYLRFNDTLNGACVKVNAKLLVTYGSMSTWQCDNREQYMKFSNTHHPYDSIPLQNLGRHVKDEEFPLVVAHTNDARVVPLLKEAGFRTLEELIWVRISRTD